MEIEWRDVTRQRINAKVTGKIVLYPYLPAPSGGRVAFPHLRIEWFPKLGVWRLIKEEVYTRPHGGAPAVRVKYLGRAKDNTELKQRAEALIILAQ